MTVASLEQGPKQSDCYIGFTLSSTTTKYLASLEPASHCQGLEFAAEGNTADPCFRLCVGQQKSKKSKSVADVPGGSGGRCHWPCQGCFITNLKEADVRSSGFEVQHLIL